MPAKEIGGQPWWVWAAGGVTVGGGYLYLRHQQNAAASAASTAGQTPVYVGQGGTGLSSDQLATFLANWQGAPQQAGTPAPGKHHPRSTKTRKAETLATLSRNYKASIPDLIKWNPHLAQYQHGGKVPKGTSVTTHNPSGYLAGK